jgi:hypothetical protein
MDNPNPQPVVDTSGYRVRQIPTGFTDPMIGLPDNFDSLPPAMQERVKKAYDERRSRYRQSIADQPLVDADNRTISQVMPLSYREETSRIQAKRMEIQSKMQGLQRMANEANRAGRPQEVQNLMRAYQILQQELSQFS